MYGELEKHERGSGRATHAVNGSGLSMEYAHFNFRSTSLRVDMYVSNDGVDDLGWLLWDRTTVSPAGISAGGRGLS